MTAAYAVRELFAVALVEERFVVVEIELGRAAGLEKVNDALGLWGEVRKGREGGSGRWGELESGRRGDGGGGGVAAEKVSESDAAESESEAVEALAAAQGEPRGVTGAGGKRGHRNEESGERRAEFRDGGFRREEAAGRRSEMEW